MKRSTTLFSIIISLFIAAACSSQSKPFTEKTIIIAAGQTVRIPELKLAITNNGCGRKWISEGDNPAYEKPFCNLVISQKDSTITGGGDFKPIYIGNVEIIIDKMNPWGREEDSVPPAGCRVLVKKLEGR